MTAGLSDGNFAQTTDLSVSGTGINATPLPAALPLFASGLGALGLLGWRRKRKGAALAA
jgi:PEP-CTERM motif